MWPPLLTRYEMKARRLLAMSAIIGGMSWACGTGGSAGRPTRTTKPVPQRLVFALDAHQITKDGRQITETEVRNLVSTMPRPRGTPREATSLPERPLSLDTFEDIWATLSTFDFRPFQRLAVDDFEHLPEPTDTAYSNRLYLSVDDVEVISLALPMGPPKDRALRDQLDWLREDIERPLRVAETKRALAQVDPVPKSMRFDFGRWVLNKQPEPIILNKYCFSSPDSQWLERALPDLERAAAANPGKLRVDRSSVEVTLSEADFLEIWQELRKVDFVRIAGLGRGGFLFRPQPVTWSLMFEIDGRLVLNLQHLDREISPAAAAPLLPIQQLFEAKLKQKLDGLRHRRVEGGAGSL
jgi:hypothetical protein